MTAAFVAILGGVRVLDLTHAWAGPFATQLLADYGAEVIKIETCDRPDMLRFSTWPTDETRPDAYNRGGWFQYLGRNKLSLTLDLKQLQGQDLFKRLVVQSDVVIETFSARVMPHLGLDYAVLQAVNPRLIMISMPGYGMVGPYKDFVAFGEMIEPFAGLSELTGYADGTPLRLAVAYPDPVAGFHAALATLLARRQRRQTNKTAHSYPTSGADHPYAGGSRARLHGQWTHAMPHQQPSSRLGAAWMLSVPWTRQVDHHCGPR
jgi:crotonobetainyl-CoA:carnitine CoA-transferase CaiB-like acyl-CoA transferase